MQYFTAPRFPIVVLLVTLAFALTGCGGGSLRCPDHPLADEAKPDFGRYSSLPQTRVGSIPFYGAFTLFTRADPNNLGEHSYSGGTDEDSRGIFYTKRGGFIDIAHVRKSADVTVYVQKRIEYALLNDWPCVNVRSREPTRYYVHFNYPSFWKGLSETEKARHARDVSIIIAQRLTFQMLTWHEMITWFGYRATIVLPEYASAFTHDDNPSHALGVILAGDALRDTSREYDEAMTHATNNMVKKLLAVDAEKTDEAIQKTRGSWWNNGSPKKRHLDIGLDDNRVSPWLVRDLPWARGVSPARFVIPELTSVHGRNYRTFYRVELDPRVGQAGRIRRLIKDQPKLIDPEKHFGEIMSGIREIAVKRYGDKVDQPY